MTGAGTVPVWPPPTPPGPSSMSPSSVPGVPMTRRLAQGCPHARAVTTRVERLLRASRKLCVLRCIPCVWSRGGMSQPRLLIALVLLLCCQVRMGCHTRGCSTPCSAHKPRRTATNPPHPTASPHHGMWHSSRCPFLPPLPSTRHGMAQNGRRGTLACARLWLSPGWGHCLAQPVPAAGHP